MCNDASLYRFQVRQNYWTYLLLYELYVIVHLTATSGF